MTDLSPIFNNGVAVGMVVVAVAFFYFKFWPWYVKRVEAQDKERKERHDQYMQNQKNQTDALNRLGDITESFALTITNLSGKMDANHADLVARLDKLRSLRDTGPLGKLEPSK